MTSLRTVRVSRASSVSYSLFNLQHLVTGGLGQTMSPLLDLWCRVEVRGVKKHQAFPECPVTGLCREPWVWDFVSRSQLPEAVAMAPLDGQETQCHRAEATCPQVTASEAQSWDSNPALTSMPLFHPSPCLSWDPGYIQMGIWLIYTPVINEANQSGKFRKLFSKEVILLSLILKFIFLIGQWYFQLSFQEEIECKWLW